MSGSVGGTGKHNDREAGRCALPPTLRSGGFQLAAHDYLKEHTPLDRELWDHLRHRALHGWEFTDSTARLCVINLFVHGIGTNGGGRGDQPVASASPIRVADSLAADPGDRFDLVLTNPPFGKKPSLTFVNEEGEAKRESQIIVRDDFWTSTSNKQLNFIRHIRTILKIHGWAAVVVPDNVPFEGGAGETIRRKLLHECDMHTLLRLPTGIFYAQGVKATVLFFDRKPASKKTLDREDEILEDSASLSEPDVLAAKIVEDLQAALEQFAVIAEDVGE